MSIRVVYSFLLFLFLLPELVIAGLHDDVVHFRGVTPDKRYEVKLIEDFESRTGWKIVEKKPNRIIGRFIAREPVFEKNANPVQKKITEDFKKDLQLVNESARLFNRQQPAEQKLSAEYRMIINKPGYDRLILHPPEKDLIYHTGRPIAIAVWVYGRKKRHTLYARFSTAFGKTQSVRLGSLDFRGWERLEAAIPVSLQKRNARNSNRFEFNFEGFKLVSEPASKEGLSFFIFDLVTILIDHSDRDYPGSDISDLWK